MNISHLTFTAISIFFVNLFFGYWRANVRKFSYQWFLAVHVPVPIVIALRILFGLGWRLVTFPILVTAFFLGQLLGGKIHYILEKTSGKRLSSCLVMDLIRSKDNL